MQEDERKYKARYTMQGIGGTRGHICDVVFYGFEKASSVQREETHYVAAFF